MIGKSKLIFLAIWVMGIIVMAAGVDTIADFTDIEVSTGNTFDTGSWRDGTIRVDVKPGSFPNPINVRSKGVVHVALLGTPDFPVDDLDPESVRICRLVDGYSLVGNVVPLKCWCEDTACLTDPLSDTGDGFDDLNAEFDKTALCTDLLLDECEDGAEVYLRVTVNSLDGPLVGSDCVLIINRYDKLKTVTTATNTTENETIDSDFES